MNYPPLVMRLDVSGQRRRLCLWIPLFLVWLVAAAVAIALAPLMLIAVAILWPFSWGKPVLLFVPLVCGCLCALRGLEVDLKQSNRLLLISFK